MEYQGYRILSREKSYNYKFGSIEEQEKHSKTVLRRKFFTLFRRLQSTTCLPSHGPLWNLRYFTLLRSCISNWIPNSETPTIQFISKLFSSTNEWRSFVRFKTSSSPLSETNMVSREEEDNIHNKLVLHLQFVTLRFCFSKNTNLAIPMLASWS
jgi:hypothetical protein